MSSNANTHDDNPNPVFSFHNNGQIVDFNLAAEKLLTWWNGDKNQLSADNLNLLQSSNNSTSEIASNGRFISYNISLSDNDNQYTFFGMDITRQKKTDIRFYGLVNEIDEAIFLIDPHDNGRIKEINGTAVRFLGYNREELLQMQVKDIEIEFPIQSKEQWVHHVEHLKGVNSLTLLGRHKRKDGSSFPVEVVLTYKEIDGQDFQMALIRDISQRLQAEKEKEQLKANLISASRLSSLGEMAGGIAHEINNPLAIIASSMDIIEQCLEDDPADQDTIQKMMQITQETVQRISKIVSGLKTVARSSKDLHTQCLSVREVFTDVLGLCQAKFKNQGIDLQVDLNSDSFAEKIHCERVQLSQALINLLTNSFQAVENLEEKWVRIEIDSDEENMKIKITDSGSRISKNIEEKIFNPFFTSKPVGTGAGLGLTMSKTIFEKHDGTLELDQNNTNTCFVASLPRGPKATEIKKAA